ncbi:MAG: FGGY-family carbohydrate kinase [Desulfobacterium sp.]|nr:FGGY-family carbohydrate kinase [Desulfobacterium sp.]
MADQTLLAIDCGTQSLRALLFTDKGDLVARSQVEYIPYVSPRPGWAEQDPEIYWNSLCAACQELKERHPTLFSAIAGVGVTSQRTTMINVDENGDPLRPAIVWLDQRRAEAKFGTKGLIGMGLKLARMDGLVKGIQTQGKCNWIMQNQPEIWEKTRCYLQVSGFLNHRLTGRFLDSVASQIGHIPFNYKTMEWASKYDLPSLFFPVPREKLPQLVKPGDLIGTITPKTAQLTGLKQGLKVIACGSDKGCETLGAGVVDDSMVSLSFGTTATVQTTTEKYYEPVRFMPPYPASIPSRYNPEMEIFRGFWMITWFKNEFAHQEVAEAKELGIAAEEVLNRHLATTDPGAMGLVVQPYWGPGLEHPCAKGAMIGFGDIHTKAHIYRAVIEGLGFALKDGLETMEKRGKFSAQRAAVSGGASQSDEICKITADIFNLPMVKGRTHETSGLGAAIITATGLGIFPSIQSGIDAMVHEETVFTPNPANVEIYSSIYSRVYQRIFRALEPLYTEIQAITGYPE